MNYCSLQEAWGNEYKKKPLKKNHKKIIETFVDENTEEASILSESVTKSCDCKKIIKHISNCKKCQKAIRDKYSPKLLASVQNILEEYRELFVLILLGICVVLFFNIVLSFNKKNHILEPKYPTFKLVPSK